MTRKGWKGEKHRHKMSAKGIHTKKVIDNNPTFFYTCPICKNKTVRIYLKDRKWINSCECLYNKKTYTNLQNEINKGFFVGESHVER